MEYLSVTNLIIVIIVLSLGLLIQTSRASHWKARAETLHSERNSSGWEDEVYFWRHHFSQESAEAADRH